jgi:uncharacterized FAD-dependent dehydrogenase
MSDRARGSAFANSALLVDVRAEDFLSEEGPLAGLAFQEACERKAFALGGGSYDPPSETLAAFMGAGGALADCLPGFAREALREGIPALGKKLKGFDTAEARLYAAEPRSSSPLRIPRGADLNASIRGIYPGGEGAGHAGGIVSAAADGVRIAEAIMRKGI